MSKRDRPTLRKFFRDGALPTSEHYGDLIDSMVNRIDQVAVVLGGGQRPVAEELA